MTVKEFEKRARYNGNYYREINEWKIIDVHEIPEQFFEDNGCDFYCCNGRNVYMLQLVHRENAEKYTRIDDCKYGYPPYLIAELPLSKIDNDFILEILSKFNL